LRLRAFAPSRQRRIHAQELKVTRENVEFMSDGLKLKGHFYTPARGKPPFPVVVMAGGWC
jgi:hypothetical protein